MTVFQHLDKVTESMNSLFRLLNPALNEIKMFRSSNEHSAYDSAYTMAAWIHHSLNVVHPFVDGNGRVTRLLSSLPLIICGFPPLAVSNRNKCAYIQALHFADQHWDLRPLARLFASETAVAIQTLESIGLPTADDLQYCRD